ncbi:MAG TPA: hypothetical protein DCQ28_11370 [Bacteroidetes bacterium]|nr:hypothetical protein [Bacteroidota bacterium]
MTPLKVGTQSDFDLKKLVQDMYPLLSEQQRNVADFLLHNLNDAPFYSVVELGKKCGASKATVVRFAQALGLSGFQELRANLLEGVQSEIKLKDKFSLIHKSDHQESLTLVAQQDVKNINQTINHLDKKVFQDVCDSIMKASHVYTIGLGISYLMSQILSYSLNQAAIRSTPLVHDYKTFLDQIEFLTPKDVLVAFSFPPYSKETIDAVKFAARKKVPIIAITDKLTSPITFFSHKVIPVRSQNLNFTNSFSAISVIINAIATELSMCNETKVLRNQKEVVSKLKKMGHYKTE